MESGAKTSDDYLSFPPSSSSGGSSFQALDVHYKSWPSEVTVTDSSAQTRYTAQGSSWKTRLEIVNGNNQPVGHSDGNVWSSKINVEMVNTGAASRDFQVKKGGKLLRGLETFTFQTFSGTTVIWQNEPKSKAIIYMLKDDREKVLADFESNPSTKTGKLQVVDDVDGKIGLDEVVVTLLTLLYRKLDGIQASMIVAVT